MALTSMQPHMYARAEKSGSRCASHCLSSSERTLTIGREGTRMRYMRTSRMRYTRSQIESVLLDTMALALHCAPRQRATLASQINVSVGAMLAMVLGMQHASLAY